MKNNSKRLLSTILALVMVIGLIVVMPTTALAKDTLIEIANIDTAAGIQTRFNTALAACSKDDTITVTGYCSGIDATLELDIPQDVTVIWKAFISCSEDKPVIELTGRGTLDVAAGGWITSRGSEEIISIKSRLSSELIVSGGKVEQTGSGDAIFTRSSLTTIRVTGGLVSAKEAHAIHIGGVGGGVNVSGGTVETRGEEGYAIWTGGRNSNINISGGTIGNYNKAGGTAIMTNSSNVTISSGTVTIDACSIGIEAGGDVIISGGSITINADTGMDVEGNVTISGGSLSIPGSESNGIRAEGDVTISGGTLNINADLIGITAAGKVEISGGISTIRGNWYGVNGIGGVTISGGSGTIRAVGVGESFVAVRTRNDLIVASGMQVKGWDGAGYNILAEIGTRTDSSGAYKTFAAAAPTNTMFTNIQYGPGADTAPKIEGPTTMTLPVGYEATSTSIYTITGVPEPTVTKTSGNAAITWNNTTKKLDIAAGLTAGTYPVALTATSGANNATLTFTLTFTLTVTTGSGGMANFKPSRTYTLGQFTDVDENQWYGAGPTGQKFIKTAFEYALVNGMSDTTFSPTSDFTLEMAIALAARVHCIYHTGADSIKQGEGANWSKPFIDYALDEANKIILPGDFPNINRPATRAEMAYIFANCLPAAEFASQNTVNKLPDVHTGTPYYESIIMLYEAGVVKGDDVSAFEPNSNMSRATAAGIITNIIIPANRTKGATYG